MAILLARTVPGLYEDSKEDERAAEDHGWRRRLVEKKVGLDWRRDRLGLGQHDERNGRHHP